MRAPGQSDVVVRLSSTQHGRWAWLWHDICTALRAFRRPSSTVVVDDLPVDNVVPLDQGLQRGDVLVGVAGDDDCARTGS